MGEGRARDAWRNWKETRKIGHTEWAEIYLLYGITLSGISCANNSDTINKIM